MNKLTKAAIAGAAGIALLLGGAGSLAYWNSSATLTGGTVNAGQLTIKASTTTLPAWKDSKGPINIATYRAIPGAVLTYTASFDVSAVGDNLKANVAITGNSIAAVTPLTTANTALATALASSVVTLVNGVAASTVTILPGTQTIVLSVQITWPFSGDPTTIDNPAMNGAVTLSNMAITLTQIP